MFIMTTKSRIDNLTTNYEYKNQHGGPCQTFYVIICSTVGIIVLGLSFLLLRDEKLQVQYYLEPHSRMGDRRFPNTLLGCIAANITSSIVQIISCLMLLYKDITFGILKWFIFTSFMVSGISMILLAVENKPDIFIFDEYFIMILINSIVCLCFLMCCNCRKCAPKKSVQSY